MTSNLNFLTWATAFLFTGLILLMGRKYILKSTLNRTDNIRGVTKRLFILAIIAMVLGALFLIPVLILY